MAVQVFLAEERKTLRRKVVWVGMAVTAATLAALLMVLGVSARMAPDAAGSLSMVWPEGLKAVLADYAWQFGALLAVVVTSALLVEEYNWRTLQLWLSRGISRTRYLVTKFAALLLPLLIIAAVMAGVGFLTVVVLTVSGGGALAWSSIRASELSVAVVRLAWALLPCAAVTFLIGVITRSTAGTLGGGLVYLFLGDQVLGGVLALVGFVSAIPYLPMTLAKALVSRNAVVVVGAEMLPMPVTGWGAALGILAWTMVLVGTAVAIFHKQELA